MNQPKIEDLIRTIQQLQKRIEFLERENARRKADNAQLLSSLNRMNRG